MIAVPLPSDAVTLERDGRVWFRDALGADDLGLLDRACEVSGAPGARLDWTDGLARAIGAVSELTKLARRLQPGAMPVRVVVFNKSSDLNWNVPWHQDRVIAVRERHDVDGFHAWTRKAGVWHVEPPIGFLREMIFARVHLDDADAQNGCLELALGSHAYGQVKADDADDVARSARLEICRARRGDVLFVKALTLHRSRSSARQTDRRTLRIDYCASSLPPPLAWAWRPE